jgi:hypothetical protein
MGRLLSLAVTGAFTITLLIAGSAAAVVCDPHCAPPKANTGGETKGLNRANVVAGDHGQHGRDKAAAKQDLHKPGGSGVVSGGTGGGGTTDTGTAGTGGTGDSGGGTTELPCTGC